jgi:hypothetical protein
MWADNATHTPQTPSSRLRDQRNFDRYGKMLMRNQAAKRKTSRHNAGDRGERRRGRHHKEHHTGHAWTV